ncbi:MAG: NAD(P)-dependent oxidoreductase [Ignisphaera sp.]
MIFGVVGAGIMGSNLCRCLADRGIAVNIYSRSFEKASKLASEIGGRAYSDVRKLVEDSDAVVIFVTDDRAVLSIVDSIISRGRVDGGLIINASTVTPTASSISMEILSSVGIRYLEGPVYGSADEARDCRLISMVGGDRELFENYRKFFEVYSQSVFYIGAVPKAMVLKLALNHIGLAVPAILAEVLALITAWNVDLEVFREVSKSIWFGQLIERYWDRIFGGKPPRFKMWMAGKDYRYIASALKEKNIPSIVAEALSTIYMMPSATEYSDKDYPQIARYFIDLANKIKEKKI